MPRLDLLQPDNSML